MQAIEREYAKLIDLNPGSEVCAFCGGIGFVGLSVTGLAEPWKHPLFGRAFPCPCGIGQRKTWAALRSRFRDPGVPDKFKDYSFDSFLARCSQMEHQQEGKEGAYKLARRFTIKRLLADRHGIPKYWLILSGEPGMGKSGLMAAIANALDAEELPVLWQDANGIVEAITDSYDDHSKAKRATRGEILEAARLVPILCIDDMGDPDDEMAASKHVRTIFYEILRERHVNRRLTVITTNLDEEGFRGMWGKRINRRVHEAGLWVPMAGDDLSEY